MAFYLTRFSYTPETWGRLMKNPEDRRDAARKYIESVGEQAADAEIIGTGPFEYASRVPSSQLNGQAFSKYWGTPASVAQQFLHANGLA